MWIVQGNILRQGVYEICEVVGHVLWWLRECPLSLLMSFILVLMASGTFPHVWMVLVKRACITLPVKVVHNVRGWEDIAMKAADNNFLSRPLFLARTLCRTNLSLSCTLVLSRARALSRALTCVHSLSQAIALGSSFYTFYTFPYSSLPPLPYLCVSGGTQRELVTAPFPWRQRHQPCLPEGLGILCVYHIHILIVDGYMNIHMYIFTHQQASVCCVVCLSDSYFDMSSDYPWIYVHTYVYVHTPEGLGMLCVWHMCILYQITN